MTGTSSQQGSLTEGKSLWGQRETAGLALPVCCAMLCHAVLCHLTPAKQLPKGRNPSIPPLSQQHGRDQRAPEPMVGDRQVRDPLWTHRTRDPQSFHGGYTGPESLRAPSEGHSGSETPRAHCGGHREDQRPPELSWETVRTRASRATVGDTQDQKPLEPPWGHRGPETPRAHPEGPQDWTPPWPMVGDNAHTPSSAGQSSRQG